MVRHGLLCSDVARSILLIIIVIAGLSFGHEVAQNAVVEQLTGLLRLDSAKMLQTAILSASGNIGNVGHAFRRRRAPGHGVSH
jgi:hypothetical protein